MFVFGKLKSIAAGTEVTTECVVAGMVTLGRICSAFIHVWELYSMATLTLLNTLHGLIKYKKVKHG